MVWARCAWGGGLELAESGCWRCASTRTLLLPLPPQRPCPWPYPASDTAEVAAEAASVEPRSSQAENVFSTALVTGA